MKEWDLIERLLTTEDLLPPLRRDSVLPLTDGIDQADALLTARLDGDPAEFFNFLVEVKLRSTPQAVQQAIYRIGKLVSTKNDSEVHPMIVVPFLSEERLKELEKEQVSGIDLCGNGIVIVPGRLLILRTGRENRYPESRPVSNPFQGKSALVGRTVFKELTVPGRTEFGTLGELHREILKRGAEISLAQVSKAVAALAEERILGSRGRAIYLLGSGQLLDRLSAAWKPAVSRRIHLKIPNGRATISLLANDRELKWAVTGESSVGRYTPFGQGGPMRIAVSRISTAIDLLGGQEERVPNFADVELLETDEPGFYFANEMGDDGIRWADKLQTWIELANGDARQQDAAKDIRHQLSA